MKPLIKWPGGKSGEIKYIKPMLPPYNRYIEPFFGGGALFFDLEPGTAVINDISEELTMLYAFLKDDKQKTNLKRELGCYVKYWDRISTYMKKFGNTIITIYEKYRHNKISDRQFEDAIKNLFKKRIVPFNGLFEEKFCINQESLLRNIEKNVISKLKRIKKKIDVRNGFTREMIIKNIETAFRSGFYMHFRDIMNKAKKGELKISGAKRIANYYFVREFCYGSMFRFNEKGEFNIPYGGIAYNTKDFESKVSVLFSDRVRRLFRNAAIERIDFEKLLKKHKPKAGDFVFLDPPYDTEFSDYEENPFTRQDQERLAKCVFNLEAKFILIIKETPFIRQLYDNEKFRKRGIKIRSFDKTYAYNMKSRNEREAKHLIIHNLRELLQARL